MRGTCARQVLLSSTQVELLMMAATIARKRGHEDESPSHIEQAVQSPRREVFRVYSVTPRRNVPPSAAFATTFARQDFCRCCMSRRTASPSINPAVHTA
jgi:hypothetical protein